MLKKLSVLIFTLLIFTAANTVSAQFSEEQIDDYKVSIIINQDSSLDVTEQINYNFGDNERHGIYRDIPTSYRARGGNFNLRLSNLQVKQDGQNATFNDSKNGNDTRLKIGDSDTTITGKHTYVINYHVIRALNYFTDHDELYWNPIGTGWQVPINNAQVTIKTPAASNNEIKAACYTGPQGSTANDCTITPSQQNITIEANNILNPGEGLTAVIGMPKGMVIPLSTWQNIKFIIADNWILLLPFIIFFIMLRRWQKYGRDAKGKTTIVPQYESPAGISPLLYNSIIKEYVSNRDLSAEIIQLAVKGYLTITRSESKTLGIFKNVAYTLTRTEKATQDLTTVEIKLLNAFFKDGNTINISDLKNNTSFHSTLTEVRADISGLMASQGYYQKNPSTVKIIYVVIGIFTGVLGSIFLGALYDVYGIVVSILSGLIIIGFGIFMAARTQKGVEVKAQILGLKKYIEIAEKDRLAFHDAPEKNPARFEALLPFAIALSVDKAWSNQFQDIYKNPPSWYHDNTGTLFNATLFSTSMNDLTSHMDSAMTTASSGSSGFSGGSGGGFGGGGGGSW